MEIQTQDCVYAIIYHFLDKDVEKGSPLLDKTQWKRLSKSGTGESIKRVFENKKTGKKVVVTSSETRILNISEEVEEKSDLKHVASFKTFEGDLSIDFPYQEVLEYATIFRKEKPRGQQDLIILLNRKKNMIISLYFLYQKEQELV